MNLPEEHLFEAIFNSMPYPAIVYRADAPRFTVVANNTLHKTVTNRTGIDITGKSIWDIFSPLDPQAGIIKNALNQVITDHVSIKLDPFRYDMPLADTGEIVLFWWQVEYAPLIGKDGNVAYIIGTTNDATEKVVGRETQERLRLQQEALIREQNLNEELAASNEELKETQQNLQDLNQELESRVDERTKLLTASESRFRDMVQHAQVGIIVYNTRELIIASANTQILKILGKSTDVIGKRFVDALPEMKGQPFLKLMLDVFDTGEVYYGNEVPAVLEHNGKLVEDYFNFIYQPVKDEQGNTTAIMVVAMTATEQVMARKRIESSEHRLNAMVKNTPIGMTVLDGRDFRVALANNPMLNIWSRTEEGVIGKKLIEIFPELSAQPFIKMLEDVFDTGRPLSIREMLVTISSANGDKNIYVDFAYQPLFNEKGRAESILVTVVEITEAVKARKALEESESEQQSLNEELTSTNEELAVINEELSESHINLRAVNAMLQDSEAKLRTMLDQLPIPLSILRGPEFVIEGANVPMLNLWKRPADEVMGKSILKIFPELLDQPFPDLWRQVIATGKTISHKEVPVYLYTPSGERISMFLNYDYHPLYGQDGNPNGVMATIVNLTDQVIAKNELMKTQDTLKMALDAAGIGTWHVDLVTDILTISDRMAEMHGLTADTILTLKESSEMIVPESREAVMKGVQDAIETKGNFSAEYQIIPKDGSKQRWMRASAKAYYNQEGKPVYMAGTALDITEQKHDEIRKNDFIGMVSHELKTPLTSLTAYVQMLLMKARKADDAFTTGALEKANVQVKRMGNMINGFLNVSRLESGKIELYKNNFSLDELLTEIIDETKVATTSHEITLLEYEKVNVNADSDKIGSVITNLLSNAIKYSPKNNAIKVSLKIIDQMAQISVSDGGIGIKPQDIDRLFERYYRVESPNIHYISGFGIGLYLSAEIVERHNGRIWAESEFGKGSTFYFSIPIA